MNKQRRRKAQEKRRKSDGLVQFIGAIFLVSIVFIWLVVSFYKFPRLHITFL